MKESIQHIFDKSIAMDDLHYWMEECSKNDDAFLTFWQYAQDDTQEKSWRALWVVEHAIKKNKTQAKQIFPDIYPLLIKTNNHSILRMGFKLVVLQPIPSNDEAGELLVKAEQVVLNSKMPIATRANALQFMFEFCKTEAALAHEMELILDHLSAYENAGGMKARIRNIRVGLQKLKNKSRI